MKRNLWKYYDKIHEHRGKVPKVPEKVSRRFCWEQEVKLAKFLGIPVRRVKIEWHPVVSQYTIYIDCKYFTYLDCLCWGDKYKTTYWSVYGYLGLKRRSSA